MFTGLLEFQRTREAWEMHFDQPSGGDLPAAPIDENWVGDGLLVFRHTVEEAEAWKQKGIQVVNLSAEIPREPVDFPRVTVDFRAVARLAAEHLAGLGVRDFVFVHESTRRYSAERLEAFRAAILPMRGRLHVIDVPASSFPAPGRPERIEECCWKALAALPRPCGILAKDDIAAVWTLNVLRKIGVRCPDEMVILGIGDDIVFCHTTQPPLSSVPYPARSVGLAAADLLHRMMRGEKVPAGHRVFVPPLPVVARESTRRVVLADAVVTRALEFIRQAAARGPVTVYAVARAAGVSRENLRQRFHGALDRSPKTQIDDTRLQLVAESIRYSNDSLESIAAQHGFAGPEDVCRFVKRMTGKTPGSMRKESA